MKVAIVGSQCVGKTTFIKDLISELPQFNTPSYTYRDAIKDAGLQDKINQNTCQESQLCIFNALSSQILKSDPNTIHDRCVMDCVAYTIWPTLYKEGETDITPEFAEKLRKTAVNIMHNYDLIVYIPVDEDIELVEDDLRDTDPVFRRTYAQVIEGLLFFDIGDPLFDKYGYKVASISGSREERIAEFKELIKHLN